jgi:hypothetical protein
MQRATGRALALVVAAAVVLPVMNLATFHRVSDGSFAVHAATHGCAAAASIAITLFILRRFSVGLPALLALAVGLTLPAAFVHAARVAGRDAQVSAGFTAPLEYGRALVPVLRGAATMAVESDHVALRTPPGVVGFLEVKPLSGAAVTPGNVLLPRALLAGPGSGADTVSWRARIERERGYFGLVEFDAERVVVQVTESGLLVTAPGANGQPAGEQLPVRVDGGWHEWAIRRGLASTELVMDGKTVWRAARASKLDPVRIGEARSDAEHGGTLRISQARVTRSLT